MQAVADPSPVRMVLRSALNRAMRPRDQVAMAAYRTALAAIDNAGAVPVGDDQRAGAVELSPVGVGTADVPRRVLSESDERQIVDQEVRELRAAAGSLADPGAADRLRYQADLLDAVLHGDAGAGGGRDG